jgi:dolichyl-diphosphooligosaccharide--protein glycosyltransferase
MDMDEENNDDEITIDFSKITNFFKRKKPKTEEVKQVEAEVKEIKQEVQEELGETQGEPQKELQKEEVKLDKIETQLEKEEPKAEKIDQAEEKLSNDIREIKQEVAEVKEEVEEIKEKEDDEEISIDFSKVKGFFKNIFKGAKKESSTQGAKSGDDEEISVDWKGISEFFVKYRLVFLLLIPILLSFFLRIQSANLPITDDWSRNNVYNYYRNEIKTQINQQYPNLPDQNKEVLVEREFQKFLSEQKGQLKQQIAGTSNYFKTRMQNDEGQTYLLAIDPYFWARHARNILENGHPGDELRDGVPYDNHMFAPIGRYIPGDMFHAYLEAYTYKFFSIFNRDLDLMKVVFYIPVILATLAVIPAFFIARRIGGNLGGVIAAIIVAIHPAFLTRTAGGFADTDAYNVLFPLLISWLFLEAFETKDIKKKIGLCGIAGLFVGMYSFTWGGWWYILAFIFATLVIYLGYYALLHAKELKRGLASFISQPGIKNTLIVLIALMSSSMIFTSLFTGFSTFTRFLISGPVAFMNLKEVGIRTVWPNVFTTVAEQNPASLNSVISQIGFNNWFLFLLGVSGLVLSTIKKKNNKPWFFVSSIVWYFLVILAKPQNLRIFIVLLAIPIIARLVMAVKEKEQGVDAKYSILLGLWMLSTIYASVKGIRFTLLLVPAFAISFGITAGLIYKYLNSWITKELNVHKVITQVSITILLLLLLISPFKSAMATAKNEVPSMNDAWWSSLDKINQLAEPDAIINSWWDFGHWFKYIGDRAVTFDGTSQNQPQAHWIGNSLLINEELTAVGILRMLDCGANNAFDELNKVINDTPRSIDILYEIIVLEKDDAEDVLENKGLSSEEVDSVIQYTHCEPPENYYITSEDMVGKAGVWSHFGDWNFDRALMYNTLNRKEYKKDKDKGVSFLQERFNMSENDAENIYYEVESISTNKEANDWIAEWHNYYGIQGCSKVDDETIECGFLQGTKVLINLDSLDANVSTQQGIMHPDVVVQITEEGIKKKEFSTSVTGAGVTLIPSGNNYIALLSRPKLADSMFTRLFYTDGHGLKYFDKFSDERGVSGGRIIVWKVNWEGNSTNVLEAFKEPEIEKEEEISNSSSSI